jgi:hypothetical protein
MNLRKSLSFPEQKTKNAKLRLNDSFCSCPETRALRERNRKGITEVSKDQKDEQLEISENEPRLKKRELD